MPRKIYVLVRTDMPMAQQIVQVGHVCTHQGYDNELDGEEHLILLQVPDETALRNASIVLHDINIKHVAFYEPDPGRHHGITAIATEPVSSTAKQQAMLQFKLWRFSCLKLLWNLLKHYIMTALTSFARK